MEEVWRRNWKRRVKGQTKESWSEGTDDRFSMEVDDQRLSVKLTQSEHGSAICSKVNGKETRWGGEMCRPSPERLEGERTKR